MKSKDCGWCFKKKKKVSVALQLRKRQRSICLKATDFKPVCIELTFEKQIQTILPTLRCRPSLQPVSFKNLVEMQRDKVHFSSFNRDFFSSWCYLFL